MPLIGRPADLHVMRLYSPYTALIGPAGQPRHDYDARRQQVICDDLAPILNCTPPWSNGHE